MIQLRHNRTSNIHIPFKSLYPAERPTGVTGKCFVELHKTIGGIKKIFDSDFTYNKCGRIYIIPLTMSTRLRAGEWTINIYIEIDGQLYKYTNLANIL